MSEREIKIKENKSISISNRSLAYDYISTYFNKYISITNVKNSDDIDTDTTIVKFNNVAGIINYPESNFKLRIYSKLEDSFDLFQLLSTVLKDDKTNIDSMLCVDPNKTVNLEKGEYLIKTLIDLFFQELKKIEQRGFMKAYSKVQQNSYFLKGKLLVSKQITKNLLNERFYCEYNSLNYICDENIIVNYALLNLKYIFSYPEYSPINEKYKFILNRYLSMFTIMIDQRLIEKRKNQILRLPQTNVRNRHYRNILFISNIINNRNFISNMKNGINHFCNFCIRTDKLFETYIYTLTKQVINTELYDVNFQYYFNSINQVNHDDLSSFKKPKYLDLHADILILEKNSDCPLLVIDCKYQNFSKNSPTSNYHQMISYLIAATNKLPSKEVLYGVLLGYGEKKVAYELELSNNTKGFIITEYINILSKEKEIKQQLKMIFKKFNIITLE